MTSLCCCSEQKTRFQIYSDFSFLDCENAGRPLALRDAAATSIGRRACTSPRREPPVSVISCAPLTITSASRTGSCRAIWTSNHGMRQHLVPESTLLKWARPVPGRKKLLFRYNVANRNFYIRTWSHYTDYLLAICRQLEFMYSSSIESLRIHKFQLMLWFLLVSSMITSGSKLLSKILIIFGEIGSIKTRLLNCKVFLRKWN